MKVVLAGAFGNLGAEILKCLCAAGHEVIAADLKERPMVLTDAIQVIECTWVRELDNAQNDMPGNLNGYEPPYHDFNGITSKFGAHFILKVDKILMKKKYADAIINGVKASDFPNLPVDYGYRDSKNFWFHRKTRMRAELLPIRAQSLESVRYAADRADDVVKFTDDALQTILNVKSQKNLKQL